MVVQRIAAVHNDWVLALSILRSEPIHQARIQLDDNIWRIVQRFLPDDALAQRSAHNALAAIFSLRQKEPWRPPKR